MSTSLIRLPVLFLAVALLAGPALAQTDPPAFQFSFGEGLLGAPRSIEIQGNEVYVLEYGGRQVSVFDLEGNLLREWGESGSGDGQLWQSQAIMVTSGGEVYISDFDHHDITVFDTNGTYLRKWGGEGTADSLLYYPWGMDEDADGNIWVSDRGNLAIKKFTPDGQLLKVIKGNVANGCTELRVVGDRIYCAIWYHTFAGLRILDLDGNVIDEAGGWQNPLGFDIAPDGDFYLAAASPSHRVYVIDGTTLTLGINWGGYGTETNQLADPWDVAVSAAGAVYVPLDDEGIVKVFSYTTAVEPTTWGRIKQQFR